MVDVQPYSGDFIEDKEMLVAMNRWQQMQSLSVAVPSELSDKDKVACWIDGIRPAKEEAYDPDTPTEKKHISTSVHIRRDYGKEQKKELYYKYSATAKQERWKFVNDFDKLTEDTNKGNLNHKMAVIYLDGNGFGKIRDKLCKTVDDEREFDRQIKDYRKKIFADLLDKMKTDEDWKNADKYRFETLLWGGDELMWVVPAWKGWETLLFFYKQSEDWIFKNTKREESPLTHAGGMVFCHHNAPIYRIKELTEKLSNSAKTEDRSKNLFAYQILESFDHISHDFDDIRRGWSTDGNAASLILDGNDMQNIQESINELKENEFPKNKLHKIIKTLRKDNTSSNLKIFLNKIIPKIIITGTMYILPIHQLAACPKKTPANKTAIAAGLNMCFFFIAKIYLEAFAKNADKKANHKKFKSNIACGGVIINTKISAVIYTDSIFTGALSILEKDIFVIHEKKVIYTTETMI